MLAVAALGSTACSRTWILTYDGNHPRGPGGGPALDDVVMTPDGPDGYAFESNDPQLRAVALPTNQGGNHRAVFWPGSAPAVLDGQSCATWSAQSQAEYTQQGAALRVATDAGGTTRALTVTKNVYYGANWIFNVHVWDTSAAAPYTHIGAVDLWSVVAGRPFPWHLCARTVVNSLEVKVWTGDENEPAWGDLTHGRAVPLASEWVYPGVAGWYIGHLPPGGSAEFTDLATWKLDRPEAIVRSSPGAWPTRSATASTERVTVSAP